MAATLSEHEAKIEQYIQSGRTEKAVELLYQMAVASAKKGFFEKSEAYRDRLYEVDSMALSRIVSVNEVIEVQKSKRMPPDYREQWASFFQKLSEEESNAFFFALKQVEVDGDRTILKQGSPNDRLFLVQQGRLKAIYIDHEKELLLRKLSSGDIFGQDTFFSVNVCTATIRTQTPVRLSCITRKAMEQLNKKYNTLESNLKKVCSTIPSLTEAIRKKGIDRRAFKRYNLRCKISFQLLGSDNPKAVQRSITAEMWDISKRGLSFYFQSKNREAVRNLIGRPLGVKFDLNIDGAVKTVAITGVVQGVDSHPLEEYSIHLQLNRPFSDTAMKTISRLAS